MTKWKCEPCGHTTEEKPGEVCLICKTPVSVVKTVAEHGKVKRIERVKKD
ncbi:MAG: hypothetical protein ACE5NL_01030 [Candidatus Hydrothermarchaeaceae archaeon]